MPSDKRARQRAAREAKLAAEAKAAKRKKQIRNAVIAAVAIVVVVGLVFLASNHKAKSASTSTTATTKAGATTTTVAGSTTTTAPGSTTTSTTAAGTTSDAVAQAAANKLAVAAGCPASTSATANTMKFSSAPPMTIDKSKNYSAAFQTTAGNFVVALKASSAPTTVNNFVFLANKGYYHCVIFHRVIPQFMDQTGDPTGTGQGGPGYTIADENPPKAANPDDQYPLGSVAMANTGQPHSGGSQFFIVAGPEGESLPNSYALFGSVSSGMSVVQKINSEGSAQGVPPDVTQRILKVTVTES